MLSSLAYEIMWTIKLMEGAWDVQEIAGLVKMPTKHVATVMLGLMRRGYIDRRVNGYVITEEGCEECMEAVKHPFMTETASKWINLVRAGIDNDGKQTGVERAAIPDKFEPLTSYTPDMEGLVDLLREELDEYSND